MIWRTDNLPCDGIACRCDHLQLNRDIKIDTLLTGKDIKSPHYKGDHHLRDANIQFHYTQDELLIYNKAKSDILFFHNLVYTVSAEGGKRLKLRGYQEEILNSLQKEKNNLIINSRQSGIDYILAIKALYNAFAYCDKSTLIVSNSSNILMFIKTEYMDLPFFIKPGIKVWNNESIEFDNGSKIKMIRPDKFKSNDKYYDLIILNDYAFFENQMRMFMNQLHIDNELIIASVPTNKDNHFYKLVNSKIFKKHYIHWSRVSDRDDDWKKDMINKIGIESFAQEYENLFKDTTEYRRYVNIYNLIK